jgi:hypothetical protein
MGFTDAECLMTLTFNIVEWTLFYILFEMECSIIEYSVDAAGLFDTVLLMHRIVFCMFSKE